MNGTKINILFVCLGNICRSPMAETIFRKIIESHDASQEYVIDSAGIIGYHSGETADNRMRSHARLHGYDITHISRQVRESDFENFDYIVAMDEDNVAKLNRLAPTLEAQGRIVRMADFCSQHDVDHIPDPYYGGEHGFELVIALLEDACMGLFRHTQGKN